MKKTIVLCILLFLATLYPQYLYAQNFDIKKESNFHLNLDVQTKYVWRGMEMMTEEAAPVLFPQLNYQNNGWYAYVMGGYSIKSR